MGSAFAEVIGDPIAHSLSPAIHRFWLERLGVTGEFGAVRIEPGALADYLDSRRGNPDWRGCSVTMPLKTRIPALLDETETGVGAVNLVVPLEGRLIGHNSDRTAIDQILDLEIDANAPFALIGAGGAARAVLAGLKSRGLRSFNLIARDSRQAEALLEPGEEQRIFGFAEAAAALDGAAGCVNATPLGMHGFAPMPAAVIDGVQRMRSNSVLLDLVYWPAITPLVAAATRAGLATRDGLGFLIAQAALAFRSFFGVTPDRTLDVALRELLAR